ncbi:U32 family peptidase [Skermanella rosea]|nr:U32 family peptidase [Skermanella rosea]UEM06331.1 U32 family peptidase [Skermanella rosea]
MEPKLTLGPVLFNWPAETWRDFHFRIADEADVDTVILGEVVCGKQTGFVADHLPAVIDRLAAAGKEILLATQALIADERDRRATADLVAGAPVMVEANDMGAVALLAGRPHAVGPLVNVYNEATLAWLVRRGARRVCLAPELSATAVRALGEAAAEFGVALEVQAFGRSPLAISARCYHARAHGLHKDGCQFVCGRDADGMEVRTLDGEKFLAVNGTQTLSHGYVALVAELDGLGRAGVGRFRLSPHSVDMVRVADLFRAVLAGRSDPGAVTAELAGMVAPAALENGFHHAKPGFTLS